MTHNAKSLDLELIIDDDVAIPQPFAEDQLRALCEAALAEEELPLCSLTIRFVSLATSHELHQTHFDVAEATDVMTFPDGSEDPETGRLHLGDLAVSPEVAHQRTQAGEGQTTWRDECHLYCLHGLLHLLGFDDLEPEDRELMWQRQNELTKPFFPLLTRGDDQREH